jgi:hypothetical protein
MKMNGEVLYMLQKGDVRARAVELGINPNLFDDRHWHIIKRGIESGLGSDIDVVFDAAIRGAIQEYPIEKPWSGEVNISVRATTKEGAERTLREMFREKYPRTEIKILGTTLITMDSIGYGHFSITYRTRQR